MDVVVLTKYVPNPSGIPPEIGPDFRLRREEGDGGLDPSDEPGVVIGARLVEQHGGRLIAVSLGPERAVRALQRALALGADEAVLVRDDVFRHADALATARGLAPAIARRSFDLVIAGVESTDGATGTMPIALAELLGLPCATFARRVAVEEGRLLIERQHESGYDDVECELPALVTVTAGVAQARYLSPRDMIQARKKPIQRLSLADLGLAADDVGATQRVTAVEIAPERQAGELVENATEAPARIVALLEEAKAI